jgi:gliding motility-associated-like protein
VNAIPDGINFDTLINPGPYTLVLQRAQGFTLTNPSVVTTFTVPFFTQLPISYTDNNLNTVDNPYTYRLDFSASTGLIGSSQSASSVYLTTVGTDNRVILTWAEAVPWQNTEYAIFRFNTVSSVWDSIGLAFTQTYTDTGLLNGQTYCYYVKSHGSYNNSTLPSLLLNNSQESCAIPVDSIPPCPPGLIINSDCYIGQNQLIWTNPMNIRECNTDDVVLYHIWYTPLQNQPLEIIATISNASDTQFIFSDLFSVAGCYAITAVDTFNNESNLSNIFCVDNCPTYELPNVFTPDGDNINDLFVPFPYRFVESIYIQVYDRWGVLVFETIDPNILWDGRDQTSGRLCSDGVYYYSCAVSEITLTGVRQRQLKGFVHLFGKNTARPQ